jgi:hypothetical protein
MIETDAAHIIKWSLAKEDGSETGIASIGLMFGHHFDIKHRHFLRLFQQCGI